MHQYLQDTEFATQNLFQLATQEEVQLRQLVDTLRDSERRMRVHQWDFQTSDLNEDFSDAYVMAAFARAANASQEVDQLKREIVVLQGRIGTRQHAIQSISGAILQIAKQGISLVHGQPGNGPTGRALGSLVIRDIIVQARNQSMHYEEGNPRNGVRLLFDALKSDHGDVFCLKLHAGQNRAKQVLDLLGWNSYAAYLDDMRTLL